MSEQKKQIVMDLRSLAVRMANLAINMRDLYPGESAALQETAIATGEFADKIVEGENE